MSASRKEATVPPDSAAASSPNATGNNPSVGLLRILLPTKTTSDAEVSTEVTMVIGAIQGNPSVFESPTPELKTIETACEAFVKSIVPDDMASNYTKRETARLRVALLTLFSQLAAYVLLVANGNPDIVNLSGFKLAKTGKRRPGTKKPDQANIRTVVRGEKPDTLKIRMNGYWNASLFLVEIRAADGKWVIVDAFDSIFSVIEVGTCDKVTIRIWGKNGTERSPI